MPPELDTRQLIHTDAQQEPTSTTSNEIKDETTNENNEEKKVPIKNEESGEN